MNRLIWNLLFFIVSTATASADQLAVLSEADAHRAAERIRQDPYLVSYCSKCDDGIVEVWEVEKVYITLWESGNPLGQDQYELLVTGKLIYHSETPYVPDEPLPEFEQVREVEHCPATVIEAIDLAYVYVPIGAEFYRCLGRDLALPCDVKDETLTLPRDVQLDLIRRRMPDAVPR